MKNIIKKIVLSSFAALALIVANINISSASAPQANCEFYYTDGNGVEHHFYAFNTTLEECAKYYIRLAGYDLKWHAIGGKAN